VNVFLVGGLFVVLVVVVVVGTIRPFDGEKQLQLGRELSGGLFLAFLLSTLAGVAAWWGTAHWLLLRRGVALTALLRIDDPIINRAAVGFGVMVTLALWSLIAAISALHKHH
jgi:hypothetical protein